MIVLLYSSAYPLVIVAAGFVLCSVLHWGIGALHKRLSKRLEAKAEDIGEKPLRALWYRLRLEWGARALRTLLWLVFIVFSLQLLPTLQQDIRQAQEKFENLLTRTVDWLLGNALSAVIVIVVTIFVMRFVAALIKTSFVFFETKVVETSNEYVQRRSQTLSVITQGIVQAVIFFAGMMVALQQAGLNITPILASAGIVGLAIGFGAQSLIKDLFAGFMILFEEQYSVGDTIKIGDVTGTVESLTLRSTRVRGGDGALTMFPNGSITTVANLSRDWMRVVLDFEVDYSTNVDQAMELMGNVARQVKEEYAADILEAPVVQGLEKVVNGNLTLRVMFKTLPAKQAEIARELRRRVKNAFDQAGIKGPVKV
ncbi:MAG TPA: mechanosensitive ion channel family protein [Blastocatellia bacterium]|nr:mechanosensitive ion channel family protein [Blastocatellia bacterium]